MTVLESLALPPHQPLRWGGITESYGAGAIAAAYCGTARFRRIRGVWQHGWVPPHLSVHPAAVAIDNRALSRREYYWVARADQEAFLRSHGFERARAIGLPVVYLPAVAVPRRAGSLLVMPGHTIPGVTHAWPRREYADAIHRIRTDFSEVVVAVHPSCVKQGYWVEEFRDLGFEVVEGASGDNENALRRLQVLLSSFEYMTTNSLGSAVAYAAYFGAKVSLFGPYGEFRSEDLARDPLYVRHPELLAPTIDALSERCIRGHYGELFVHPAHAVERQAWARAQMGYGNRLSPSALRRALGLTSFHRLVLGVQRSLGLSE